MSEEGKIKNATQDINTFETTANYLFTGKCRSCNKYYENNGEHHCTSLNPFASSHKSVKGNFKEFNSCPAFKTNSTVNKGRFQHTYLLFIMTMGIVIFGLITRPLLMLQKYWFFGALGVGLMIMSFIRYRVVGKIVLNTEPVTEKQKTLNKFFNRFIAIGIFIAYFLYNNGFQTFSDDTIMAIVTWLIFFIILIFIVSKVWATSFEWYMHAYEKCNILLAIIIILAVTIGLSIIFGVINLVLGLVLLGIDPAKKGFSTESSIVK
jgi:hypothetical protein